MKLLRLVAVALPVIGAALPLGDEPPPPPAPPPPAHAVDIWLGHSDTVGGGSWGTPPAPRLAFGEGAPAPPRPLARTLGAGFRIVGSVAVLEGDETTTTARGTRRAITNANLGAVSLRFLAAFGDHYDQLTVFLAFTDADSPLSLAYQSPIKNDVQGIGLGLFDYAVHVGSPSGRMQTILNMKRVLIYGRDASNDPDNDLYSVWAQEAAHRWLVYFKFRRDGEAMHNQALLGRQNAHWARGVQADGSIMDGYLWKDNADGTFTPVERSKRYGALDQYGMGLRTEGEVPPFFLIEEIRREQDDTLVDKSPVMMGGRYKARKTMLTVKDIVRAMGPRVPATDPAAQDMRMGVILLTPPGVTADDVMGEAYRIDNTRRLWDDFYNTAGGGRGKVCTQLQRPCRGVSVTYGTPTFEEAGPPAARDGVLAPGELFTVTLPVTNEGTEAGPVKVKAEAAGLRLSRDVADAGTLAVGRSAMATFAGEIPLGTPCGEAVPFDVATVETGERRNPSHATMGAVFGLVPGARDDLEDAAGRWKIDPAGTDTARTGRWELASPERSELFDFVVQPGAPWSGNRALVTGPLRGSTPADHDVGRGVTTVESPPFSLDGLRGPRLSYQAYFVAADFDREVLIPGSGDSLRVLASADGTSWTEVDRLTGMALGWQRRIVRLADKLPAEALAAPSLRLRFVAEDGGPADNVVEAVIDDVALFGEAPTCGLPAPPPPPEPTATDGGTGDARTGDGGPGGPPGTGCDCQVGAGRRLSVLPPAIVGAFALALARRRRRRPQLR